ncbi:hypothetical protein PR202_gb23443 [Eleusine coracana subsp. coracana]|uniref:Uncharacterized protein n=1 Tax=Eleusine coracana subsp. coracana TaxID=191504 RepID=A0AAV5FG61_ELECO|nr:hypothetical protein PR202_gb23443 [Eleusine coracana subsp. coracana]
MNQSTKQRSSSNLLARITVLHLGLSRTGLVQPHLPHRLQLRIANPQSSPPLLLLLMHPSPQPTVSVPAAATAGILEALRDNTQGRQQSLRDWVWDLEGAEGGMELKVRR